MQEHKFNYQWKISDGYPSNGVKYHGSKVFSCFACGGGSTMGYKLAGYDVLGMNEIDPKMASAYIENHNPKYAFVEPIQDFKNRKDLPVELFDLDILDGSPPCSSFSIAGNREKDWGKKKKFREGQSKQVLDTLFFDFIDLAKRLQPKIVVAENVKGILLGRAKKYVIKIYKELESAGYYVNHFLLDSSKMGVPQKRERVFFVGLRKDLAIPFLEQVDMFSIKPKIDLYFNESEIPYGMIKQSKGRPLSDFMKKIWENRKNGDLDMGCTNERFRNKPNTGFSQRYVYKDSVCGTLTSHEDCQVLFDEPRYLSVNEFCQISTFPSDYGFLKLKPFYLIGMSVPPIMTAKIADRIYKQWLKPIRDYQNKPVDMRLFAGQSQ